MDIYLCIYKIRYYTVIANQKNRRDVVSSTSSMDYRLLFEGLWFYAAPPTPPRARCAAQSKHPKHPIGFEKQLSTLLLDLKF